MNNSQLDSIEFDVNGSARVGIHLAATNPINTALGTAVPPGTATVAVPGGTAVPSAVLIGLVAARWIPTRAEPFTSNSMLSNCELFIHIPINIVPPGQPFQRI